jgi:hypothetical protein
MARLRVLPVAPLGSSSTTATVRGYLYAATRSRAYSRRSAGADVTAVAQDDDGGDLLAEHGVGDADHRGLLE